jgi:hypothetical protein
LIFPLSMDVAYRAFALLSRVIWSATVLHITEASGCMRSQKAAAARC